MQLVRVRLPLVAPLWSAHGTEVDRDLVVVAVTLDDGTVGWGECSALAHPTYTGEYTAGAWAVLRDELAPALLAGREAAVVGHPMAVHALQGARLDAGLRRRGRRLAEDLGERHGRPTDRVASTAVLGRAESIDELLAAVAAEWAAGAALVKLKVTPHPGDLDAVTAVRATWTDAPLAVDGNGSLDGRSLSILDGLGLAYIEQPLPADALVESAAAAGRLATPVALDESITSMAALEVALTLGAGRVINVKPARLGGIHLAADVARVAVDAGAVAFVGGMLETGVGRASALALAALPCFVLPTDLGPSRRYFETDLTEPIEADADGRVVVPSGPGIGVVPVPERLGEVAVEGLVLRR